MTRFFSSIVSWRDTLSIILVLRMDSTAVKKSSLVVMLKLLFAVVLFAVTSGAIRNTRSLPIARYSGIV